MKISCAALFFAAAGVASGEVIYDTMSGHIDWTTTGSLPRDRMADDFSTSAPGAGKVWRVDLVETALVVTVTGQWDKVSFVATVWDEFDGNGFGGPGTNIFQSELSTRTLNIAPFSTTGTTSFVVQIDFTSNPLYISDPNNLGFEIQWLNDGVADFNLATGLRDVVPLVGASNDQFYRDNDSDEVIETTDARTIAGWTNSSLALRITATEVPGPASLSVIAAAGFAAGRRRRG